LHNCEPFQFCCGYGMVVCLDPFQVHSWMTVTVGFLMYVVPNLIALYYDCVMFYLVNLIY